MPSDATRTAGRPARRTPQTTLPATRRKPQKKLQQRERAPEPLAILHTVAVMLGIPPHDFHGATTADDKSRRVAMQIFRWAELGFPGCGRIERRLREVHRYLLQWAYF